MYPPVEPTDEFFEVLPLITGEFETFARGRGDDLYLIREYMPEDSARHVDWKATAKSGSLKVREFSREDERKLRMVFDNPGPGTVSEQAYENAVTAAASLGWHFAEANAEFPSWRRAIRGGRTFMNSSSICDCRSAAFALVARQSGNFRRLQHHSHHSSARNNSQQSVGLLVLYFHREQWRGAAVILRAKATSKAYRKERKGFRKEQRTKVKAAILMQPHGMGLHPKIERRFCLASRKLNEVNKT